MYELFTFDLGSDIPAAPSPPPPPVATRGIGACTLPPQNTLISREKSGPSQVSQMSLVARYMALDPLALELFEERAAILEYDAGLSRSEAERRAFAFVMARYRDG